MNNEETLERFRRIEGMEDAIVDARRTLTLAEVDLAFARLGHTERIDGAKIKMGKAAKTLNERSEK